MSAMTFLEKESYVEADVVRCKNGPSVNFTDAYMRRRDPDCMYIGDELPTDKPKFEDRWGYKFSQLRQETMDWISHQELVVMPFIMGSKLHGYESLVVAPANAAFFAFALANIQKFISIEDVEEGYTPRAIIYVAPAFRHTHFGGKRSWCIIGANSFTKFFPIICIRDLLQRRECFLH